MRQPYLGFLPLHQASISSLRYCSELLGTAKARPESVSALPRKNCFWAPWMITGGKQAPIARNPSMPMWSFRRLVPKYQ